MLPSRDCARSARDFSANGIMDDYSVMRHMMNLEPFIHTKVHMKYTPLFLVKKFWLSALNNSIN